MKGEANVYFGTFLDSQVKKISAEGKRRRGRNPHAQPRAALILKVG
jgi:hypothetical protein